MPEIIQLPPLVINQIAAGEVIERPASVVKELLENAVDAGATRIDVSIEQGGAELIRVVDNGCGMSPDQLPLAVASHATSKIRTADDLFHVGTLGFRGEALASIAAVSQLTLRSRPVGAAAGAELEVHGGNVGQVVPCGCAEGTAIEVRNVLYNTPARRKFLRTTQTEMSHASEAFTRLALALPETHFTLKHGTRTLWDLPPVARWHERIAALMGSDVAQQLIAIESEDGPVRLSGYVANPQLSRANNRMQYVFLNGRYIRDRALQHALGEAYRGLLLTGRYPVVFLRLEIPPGDVDVNVHPTKLEVRFQDSGRIYSQLLGTMRTRFLTMDLGARVGPDRHERAETAGPEEASPETSPGAHDAAETQRLQREFVDWAKGALTAGGTGAGNEDEDEWSSKETDESPASTAGLRLARLDQAWPAAPAPRRAGTASETAPATRSPSPAALQIHDRYLVAESEEGVVIIDQHALHERILYEQLRERVLSGSIQSQQLLVPEPVHLTSSEAAAALEAKDLLARIGIRIEPFGADTVLVGSYPAMLSNLNPAEMLRSLVEQLMAGGKQPEPRDVLDELLHMMSCKAAIKAGDPLASEEIAALLAQRHLVQDSHHCPHGRPTSLLFTREELDRRFKRT